MNRPNRDHPQDGDNGKNVADEKPQDEHYEKLHQLPRNTPEDLAALRREVLSIFMELLPKLKSNLRKEISGLSPQDIEEVLSKAQVKLISLDFNKKALPRKDAYFYTMVHRLGLNVFRENERRKKRMERLRMDAQIQSALGGGVNDGYPFDETHFSRPLQEALNELPKELRELILLIAIERELTNQEIAELLEIPVGTVASRIVRANRELTKYLRSMASDHVEAVLGEGFFKRVDERNKAKEAKKEGPKS